MVVIAACFQQVLSVQPGFGLNKGHTHLLAYQVTNSLRVCTECVLVQRTIILLAVGGNMTHEMVYRLRFLGKLIEKSKYYFIYSSVFLLCLHLSSKATLRYKQGS